ncbi:hypothetical protein ACFV6Z_15500 [Streptomyces sp. NPDC059818]|uniref:hypothetical protein n=1 Tax=Streptomyces sp. NPDC059818 TaxID=3346962 RepID=UPI003649E63B
MPDTTPTTDLRDRIAAALLARLKMATVSKTQPFDAVTSLLAPTEVDLADAVLAVLPAPVDRAAVLREAADIAETLRQFEPAYGPRKDAQISENVGVLRVADHLRRMADEAQQPETEAHPAEVTWIGEIQESDDLWGYLRADHDRAVVEKRTAQQQKRFPAWNDGTPIRTRIVRKTTTYTVAVPAEPPVHLAKGTNAEDCPACKGTNPDYPFLCPGPNPVAADQPDTETEAAKWRGATELAPDREIQALAATGLVGYRQGNGRLLHCLAHKPAPASRWADFHEVTADDLDDGGMCVHPRCGRDLLARWPAP